MKKYRLKNKIYINQVDIFNTFLLLLIVLLLCTYLVVNVLQTDTFRFTGGPERQTHFAYFCQSMSSFYVFRRRYTNVDAVERTKGIYGYILGLRLVSCNHVCCD